jgi:hypothetical protein
MHRKTRDADDELTNMPGMQPEVSRTSPGLRAAVDRNVARDAAQTRSR